MSRLAKFLALVLLLAGIQWAAAAPADADADGESAKLENNDDPRMFQGDMIVDPNRSALKSAAAHWDGGKVYYVMKGSFSYKQRQTIKAAMRHIESKSCIRFLKRTTQKAYINIDNSRSGCFSSLGKSSYQPQTLNLASGCLYTIGTPAHEMMHALGFFHEQSRPDRDQFITVHWENITPGKEGNFRAADSTKVTDSGTKYDYGSVMHYSKGGFSKNGQPTLVPKNGATIGQRKGLSELDFKELNRVYGC